MILLISVLIFLFTLYVLSADDFVFMRKNVSQITLFDIAVIAGLVGLFFSRLAYASFHPSFSYLNPLIFFVIPYFPGLSFSGFLIGSCLSIYMMSVRGKLPTGRIFDVMALSLFPPAVAVFLWEAIRSVLTKNIFFLAVYIGAILIYSIYFLFSKNSLLRSSWRDGTISIISLTIFSLLQLGVQVALAKFKTIPIETPVFALLLCTLFISFLIKKFRRERV